MKKLIFALACIVVTSKLSAQINKGQWLAGGNINWTSSFNSYYNSNATVISFMPDAGYFFIDKLAGGLNLVFNINNPSGNDFSTKTYGVSPFVRYYFLPKTKSLNLFAQAAYGWNRTNGDGLGGSNINSHQWSFSAGPAIFLNPHVALEFALNYTNMGGPDYSNGNPETFGLNIGFQIHLGK
jgi:Outer membrane protein beta-barrel domain